MIDDRMFGASCFHHVVAPNRFDPGGRGERTKYQACFHPNGWLRFGNLKEPTIIQGVPCEKSTRKIWLTKGPSGIYFHDNGRLKGCRLSRDVQSFKKHKRIEIDREGNVVNVIFEEDEGK